MSHQKTTLLFISLSIISICASYAFSQTTPPADIVFSLQDTPQAGSEIILKLKVTPQEDIYGNISCIFPKEIKLLNEEEIRAEFYRDRYLHEEKEEISSQTIVLWVGPLLKEEGPKEFSLHLIIPNKERHEFIARVEAMSEWATKEEVFVIDLR